MSEAKWEVLERRVVSTLKQERGTFALTELEMLERATGRTIRLLELSDQAGLKRNFVGLDREAWAWLGELVQRAF